MVIETDTNERAPILERPFLNTWGAVIYASAAKISFYIKEKKETFSFKKQDYTNPRAIPTRTKEEDQQEEQEQVNVYRVS